MFAVEGCADLDASEPTGTAASALTVQTGVDYAWDKPSPQALRAGGYTFAARYLSYDTTGKNLTAAEASALRAAGVDVVANWEYATDAALDGRAQGVADAQEAQRQATAAGMPAGRPIYFSVDFDATASQQAAINAYFDGVASVIGLARTGGYGGYPVINRLFNAGKITWGWQTYAWSAGQWDSRAQLRQVHNGVTVGGADVDIDEAQTADFGQWGAATSDRIGVLAGDGHFYVKEGGLSALWTDEYSGVVAGYLAGDRIGVVAGNGHLYVKDGGLSALWTDEHAGVVSAALAGDRIGYLGSDGHFYVKDGGLSALWTDEHADVVAGYLAGDRIGVLTKDGHLLVKDGGLSALWTDEHAGVVSAALAGDRIGVLTSDGHFYVKDGGLSALWTDEYPNVVAGYLAGDRIGVLATDGHLYVKDGGLSAAWTDENTGVVSAALSGNRIGVLLNNGHFYVKDGGLSAGWVDERSDVTAGVLFSE